ncbi:MAG: Na+/H+ antiporter NhaA [Chloroflexi bacterium]|nr:Na+/H+ antiporter NhaA [Chloroflexota bacterium]
MHVQADRSYLTRTLRLPAQQFFHAETIGAVVLLLAAIAALVWANSPWKDNYHDLLHRLITVDVSWFAVSLDIEHWINDGLMAIFFFVVGMEIKREMVHGELSDRRKAALPVLAALGGMIAPALIYFAFTGTGDGAKGWGIPMATDIAFALGALALVGRGLPKELRTLLLALAVADDIGAILVIAVFYTDAISWSHLGIAAALIGGLVLMNRIGVRQVAFYILVGALAWVAMLKSGVHATIAGVAIGLLTPAEPYLERKEFGEVAPPLVDDYQKALAANDTEAAGVILGRIEELAEATESPLERLERQVHPWSSFLILPIFALANAGIELTGDAISDAASSPVTQGVLFGLLAGKAIGITLFSWLSVRLGIAALPTGVTWKHVFGVGILGGIGFTVAIFISGLAFDNETFVADAKIGIFAASLIAGILGFLYLRLVTGRSAQRDNSPIDNP